MNSPLPYHDNNTVHDGEYTPRMMTLWNPKIHHPWVAFGRTDGGGGGYTAYSHEVLVLQIQAMVPYMTADVSQGSVTRGG